MAATDGTLNMGVASISVSGDYAQVNGVLRARKPGREELAVRFEGRWRFAGGVPVEHWEKVSWGGLRMRVGSVPVLRMSVSFRPNRGRWVTAWLRCCAVGDIIQSIWLSGHE